MTVTNAPWFLTATETFDPENSFSAEDFAGLVAAVRQDISRERQQSAVARQYASEYLTATAREVAEIAVLVAGATALGQT